jgi:hypothetical protein
MSLSALELEELRVSVFNAMIDYGNMLKDVPTGGGGGVSVSDAMHAVVANTMEIAQNLTSLRPQFAAFVVEIGKYYAYFNEFERAKSCFQHGLHATELMGMEDVSVPSSRDAQALRLQIYLSLAYVCKEME